MQGGASKFRHHKFFRYCASVFIIIFSSSIIFPPHIVQAQIFSPLNLPLPGAMVTQTPGYIPTLIKGIEINSQNPFQFNFIIDTGESQATGDALKDESLRVIKYFLASLTVPENEVWVNLSPYEQDRIIPESFGKTGMGMDLLAEDYLLKQLTASLMYPEEELGKKFWDRVRIRVQEEYGMANISSDLFHKVWIVPKDAEVVQIGNKAFVVNSSLEVLLEQDYLALRSATDPQNPRSLEKDFTGAQGHGGAGELSKLQTEIMREIIIPEITKEVNEGENFARLRQIYNATILATWFKITLKESILGKVYVDQNKVFGIDTDDLQAKEKIYAQYLEAFKKGVYDYIKEDENAVTGEIIPRRYFSGGYSLESSDGAMLSQVVEESTTVIDPSKVILPDQQQKVFQATQPNAPFSQIFNIKVNFEDPFTIEQFRYVVPTEEDIEGLNLASVRKLLVFYRNLMKINMNRIRNEDVVTDKEHQDLLDQDRSLSKVLRILEARERTLDSEAVVENLVEGGLLPGQYELNQEIIALEVEIAEMESKNKELREQEDIAEIFPLIQKNLKIIARKKDLIDHLNKKIGDVMGTGDEFVASLVEEHPERVLAEIRKKYPKVPEFTSQILLDRLLSVMLSREFLVHDVTLEAIFSELEGIAQTALGKGGLGFLAGETFGAYHNGIGVMPLYDHPMKEEGEPTPESIDWDNERGIHRVYVKEADGKEQGLTIDVEFNGENKKVQVYWVNRKGTPVFLLRNAEIFDQLYPEPSNGTQRMLQYGFIGKAYVALMNQLGIAPDILRLNEAQLVFVEKAAEQDVAKNKDSVFKKRKTVMTNHTPERAALPVFEWERKDLEGILGADLVDDDMYQDEYGNITYKDGRPVIRASEVLARKSFLITTVSEEHSEVTKRHVLPQFAWKTTFVQNGSDPDQWHAAVLEAMIKQKGFENISGKDLFEIAQQQKKLLNEWLLKNGFNQFADLSRPLFGAVRRLVEYKEQGIFIPMVRWMTGDIDKEYETPWGRQKGLGANLLIGGPISDGVGAGWANEFRKLQEDPEIKGKLVFIDKTGTDIMRLATSAVDAAWLESPRPTREASGTSHQRAELNGKLVIASATGGQLELIDHGKNGWLVDVFETGGFTREFDEVADALDDSSHPRYWEYVQRYRSGAQKLFGQYMTEAVSLHNAYKKEGDPRILHMMKDAFVKAHERIGIDRMMESYEELFGHVLNGTGAAGYESRQIPAKEIYENRGEKVIQQYVVEHFKLDGQEDVLQAFLLGRGPIVSVINAVREKNPSMRPGVAQAVVLAAWLAVAYDLPVNTFSNLIIIADGNFNRVQRLNLSFKQQENLKKDIEALKRVIEQENALRWIDQEIREGKKEEVPPEMQHVTRKKLAEAWQSMADRRAAAVDQAMIGVGQNNERVGGIDLNSAFLDLKIRRDDKGMILPISQQPMKELLSIEGLMPVIINITPIQSLPLMLGLDLEDEGPEALESELDLVVKLD